jgi:phosphopentomutase
VLDSFGIGSSKDADKFGDAGSDTLGHIAEACFNEPIPKESSTIIKARFMQVSCAYARDKSKKSDQITLSDSAPEATPVVYRRVSAST